MKRTVWGLSLGILIPVASALWAGGFALSGVGIRALQLGGAARTLAGDPSTIFWNPAALAYANHTEIQLYNTTVMPDARYQPYTGLVGYDGGYSTRLDIYAEAQTFQIPGFLMVVPGKFANVSIGVFAPFGLGAKWDLYDYPLGWHNPEPYPEIDWSSDLQVLSTYVGIARKINDRLAVGLSGGANFTKVNLQRVNLVPADPQDPGSVPLPYSYIPVDVQSDMKGTGFGVNLGLFYRASDQLDMAFSTRLYSPVSLSGNTDFTAYFPDTSQTHAWKLSSTASASTDFPLPHNFGVGFAYRPSEQLTFRMDLDYTLWSLFDVLVLEFDGLGPTGEPLDSSVIAKNWNNTLRVSGGLEYDYGNGFRMRLGVYYDQTPIPDGSIDPLIPDISEKLSFNGGLSYTYPLAEGKALTFYLGGEYISFGDRVVYQFMDVNNDHESDNMPGIYSLTIGAVNFGLSVTF